MLWPIIHIMGTVTARRDHYFPKGSPSVPKLQNQAIIIGAGRVDHRWRLILHQFNYWRTSRQALNNLSNTYIWSTSPTHIQGQFLSVLGFHAHFSKSSENHFRHSLHLFCWSTQQRANCWSLFSHMVHCPYFRPKNKNALNWVKIMKTHWLRPGGSS